MPAITDCLPGPGDTVRLDATASPEYARDPFYLLLTERPVASTLDAAEGRSAETALYVLLTGWQLTNRGQRLQLHTHLPARRHALVAVVQASRSPTRGCTPA